LLSGDLKKKLAFQVATKKNINKKSRKKKLEGHQKTVNEGA
jgi:hypothetical protein